MRQLPLQGLLDLVEQRLVPGDQDAGGRVVLGLGDQVGGDVIGQGGVVGQDHHFRRAGQAIDGHLSEDVLLGQGDEDVAGADDHVDGGQAFDAVGQGRHRLGPADAVDLVDAQLVTGGQQIAVAGPVGGRRHHHGDLVARRRPGPGTRS